MFSPQAGFAFHKKELYQYLGNIHFNIKSNKEVPLCQDHFIEKGKVKT